jgi:hypothetical protein
LVLEEAPPAIFVGWLQERNAFKISSARISVVLADVFCVCTGFKTLALPLEE